MLLSLFTLTLFYLPWELCFLEMHGLYKLNYIAGLSK